MTKRVRNGVTGVSVGVGVLWIGGEILHLSQISKSIDQVQKSNQRLNAINDDFDKGFKALEEAGKDSGKD